MKWRTVTRADAPMNPGRWLCVMDCGHEQWVTHKSKPKRARCQKCIDRKKIAK